MSDQTQPHVSQANRHHGGQRPMGAFSVSLSVADLGVSRDFYERIGFEVFGGDEEMGFLMLRCGAATIGLFQGMFEGNILTFNPGWGQDGQNTGPFTDIRELASSMESLGIQLTTGPESGDAPSNLTLVDPDGNAILIDQHIPRND